MSADALSICIPTRNQADMILDTLRSAFAQTRPAGEVVVSDDASTDDTPGVVAAYAAALPAEQRARLRYVRHPEALGIGGNFDAAVRLTRGEFCVKVDSDDILEPHFAATLVDLLEHHPRAGWAHGNILNIAPDGRALGLAHTAKPAGFTPAPELFRQYLRHNDTCHCVLIRRSAYEAAGGYRPEMKTCEDWLLWLEMALAGFGTVYAPAMVARMRKYESRPEIMSRRREAFVVAAGRMIALVREALEAGRGASLGITAAESEETLRRSVAEHVRLAALHEEDAAVRGRLYAAMLTFDPSRRNRAWAWAGAHAPPAVVRLPTRIEGALRQTARRVYRAVAGRTRT